MPELIIGLSVICIISFGIWIYINHKQNQMYHKQAITSFKRYGNITLNDKSILFETTNQTYEVLFYKIAKTHELTINSKYIWEIHMKHRSSLINQISFLSSSYPKLVIIYPIETKLKRFINENEMVFIDYKDEFYNMRLIKINELECFLNEVVK